MVPEPKTARTAWLPFALCLLLTAAASLLVGYAERQAERARFANAVVAARGRIEERMASYMAVLRASSGMLSITDPVSAEDFHHFVNRLKLRDHYPGTQGIGYTARFGAIGASEATARAHAEGWTDVRVWPETPRDEVHAIVLLEPHDARNRAALGFDMRTEPTRREAMDRARDAGTITMTGKVTLVQEIEPEKQPGFLLYAPVYSSDEVPASVEERRLKLKGYAYAPLRAGDLFEGIFGNEHPPVEFALYDGGDVDDAALLYTFGTPIGPRDTVAVETFTIAHHVWTARFAPVAPLAGTSFLKFVVAGLGCLLSGAVLLTTRARERARSREVRAIASAMASEEMLRLKDMFIGILGHDLQSPLTAISIASQMLLGKSKGDQDTTNKLERIWNSAARMATMIDQILDLTRAGFSGGIPVARRRVQLGDLVRDVVDEVARANSSCRIDLDTKGDLEGEWDPDRLAQVFSNLVGNAVRYHLDAPVLMKLDGTSPERVVVTVQNAGLIPPALLPVVFEPFRGEAAPRKGAPGLGLGLFITRSIAQAHGGSVDVTSREGEGTTFTVVLPRGDLPARTEARAPVTVNA